MSEFFRDRKYLSEILNFFFENRILGFARFFILSRGFEISSIRGRWRWRCFRVMRSRRYDFMGLFFESMCF